jgi:signal transduction histidine kinase
MKIRARLTILFTVIFTVITIGASFVIYLSSASYREDQFYVRLEGNAINTARLLIKVKEINSDLLKIINENKVGLINEQIFIYNSKNDLIYKSKENSRPTANAALLNKIRRNREIRYKQNNHEEVLGMVYEYNKEKFVVISSAIDKYGYNKIQNLKFTLVIVSLSTIIITLIAGWLYAGHALKPIAGIISKVDEISATKLHERLDEGNGNDEIAQLAITFNKMLERLESAFQMQRNFISYASHELRTPLTAITAQLDVMLQKPRDEAYYHKVSVSVMEDIKQLSSLSNGFLNLAHANLDRSEINFDVSRVDELLWEVRDEIIKLNPDYKVNIDYKEFPEQESALEIHANEHLLKVAFSNIIENACKYSPDNKVKVEISIFPHIVKIAFADNGIGIPKEDMEKIFEPFYRGANVSTVKGHGLGLPLTQRIIKQHNGELNIHSERNLGTTIEVQFATIA